MTALRIGLLGAGSVGERHVRAAAGAADYKITAVCDVNGEAAEKVAPAGAAVFTDHRRMFADAGLDAVVVTTPHGLHADHTVDAARAGLHVLVEKPMATTVADCSRMIDACEEHGTLLAVAHVIHFEPVALEARRLIASGEFGAPVLIAHRRSAHYARGTRPGWFFDPDLAGGGIVLNVGSHGLDRIQWFGDAPVRRVSGAVHARDGLEVETDAVAFLELANRVPASLVLTSGGAPYPDETDIVMPDATLRVSGRSGLQLLRGGETVELLPAGGSNFDVAFRAQLAGFVAAASGGAGAIVDGAYGRSVVAAALALYRAAADGDRVECVMA